MDSPALSELTQRVRGAGAAVAGALTVEASLGSIAVALRSQEERQRRIARSINWVVFPAVSLVPVAGVLPTDPATALLGPEDGQVWDVRRLTVAGLVAAGGAPAAASGSVITPGATTTIAQIAANTYTPGTYLITWNVGLAGTPGAADVDNFQLRIGSTTILASDNPGAVGLYPQASYGPVTLRGAQGVTVRSIGAATAGAVYSADITLTPVANDEVSVYREIAGTPGGPVGNPENYLWTFTPPGSGPGPTWTPGKNVILRAPEQFLLTGTGLAATQVVLSGEGIAMEDDILPLYLA